MSSRRVLGFGVCFCLCLAAGCSSRPRPQPIAIPEVTVHVPRSVLRNQLVAPTVFCAGIGRTRTLTWRWGDGDVTTTATAKAEHRYREAGFYTIEVVERTVDGGEARGSAALAVYALPAP